MVTDGVVERIARQAACEVDGVWPAGSDLEGLVGRRLPRVSVEVAGNRARLTVEVAVAWPRPLAMVSAQVRDRVAGRVSELAGLRVDAVDVEVTKVHRPGHEQQARVQ